MRRLGKAAGLAILVLSAGALWAQTPTLSSIEAPYPALQSRAKINGTWYAAGSVAYGPVGTPLLLTGSNFTSASAVTFSGPGGTTVQASPTPWTSTVLVVNVPAGAVTGNVTVSSGAATSNALPFSVTSNVPYSGMCPAMPTDAQFQIVTSSLRDGTIFSAYSVSLEATGGTPPYSWSLASGVLPPGLSFSSGGTISGTPTSVTGGLNLTIAAADSLGQTTQALFSLTIDPLPPNNGNHTVYRYSVSPGQFDSNGNILGYTDSVMGNWAFSYDTLNRLKHSSATAGDFDGQYGCWSYDSFGNRTQQILSSADFQSGSGGASACQPQASATVATVLADFNSSNRVTSTNARGVAVAPAYDGAGNILSDGANSYLYDPEGRICAVKANIPTGGAIYWGYLYDAEGSRVAKGSITSLSCDLSYNGFQVTEQYVSGQSGEQLAVLDGSGAWKRSNVYGAGRLLATYDTGGLHFHVTDPLGTRRVQTSSAGVAELACENLPFGDDQNCFVVPNSSGAGDSTTLHFTGKERDTESGNDYFGARYYASSMGRFLSPDWSAKIIPVPYAKLDNPQSLNLYAYVGNNPLSRFDPDGHWVCHGNHDQCAQIQAGLSVAQTAEKALAGSNDPTARSQAKSIQKALDLYGPLSTKRGDKGDNGVNVSFGKIDGISAGQGVLGADGHSVNIKFDLQLINNTRGTGSFGSGMMSLDLRAGLTVHEGTHGVDERKWGHNPIAGTGQEDWTEHNAYRNESFTYQGLNFPFTTLWQPGMSEDQRNQAIDRAAKESDKAAGGP
jgi:RHS repeat-associated protein